MKPHSPEHSLAPDALSLLVENTTARATDHSIVTQYVNSIPFRQATERLATGYKLDPGLAESYGADYGDLFDIGIPTADSNAAYLLSKGRAAAVASIITDYSAMLGHKYIDPNAAVTPDIQMTMAASEGERQLEAFMKGKDGKAWLRNIREIGPRGFGNSPVLSAMYKPIVFDHFPESDFPGSAFAIEHMGPADLSHVFGGNVPERPTMENITVYRRQHGLVDLSRERLDKRVDAMIDAANVEYAVFILCELRRMGAMGGAYETQARKLFTERQDDINGPNIAAKGDLMRAIAEAYDTFGFYARGGKRQGSTKAFRALSEYASAVTDRLEDRMGTIVTIYNNRGEPLPQKLASLYRPEEPGTPEDTELGAETQPIEASPEAVATDAAAKAVLEELLQRLIVENLDEVALPAGSIPNPEALAGQLKDALRQTSRSKETVDKDVWQKVVDIATICIENGGKMYRTKHPSARTAAADATTNKQESFQKAPPYFVAVFERDGRRVAVAETEKHGNATYVIDENNTWASWLDVLVLERYQARDMGAIQVIHSKSAPYGPVHRQKIMKAVDSPAASAK